MKTVNRGWLRKQIESGNVEVKCNYRLTDDYAYDNATNFGQTEEYKQAVLVTNYDEATKAIANGLFAIYTDALKSKSGMAYKDGEKMYLTHAGTRLELRLKSAK